MGKLGVYSALRVAGPFSSADDKVLPTSWRGHAATTYLEGVETGAREVPGVP
jgi:hypothetical protein